MLACIAGQWTTPPVEHGLLRGTLRQELLGTRLVEEAELTKDGLRNAHALAAINSVRGVLMLRPKSHDLWLLEPILEGSDCYSVFGPLVRHVHQVMSLPESPANR